MYALSVAPSNGAALLQRGALVAGLLLLHLFVIQQLATLRLAERPAPEPEPVFVQLLEPAPAPAPQPALTPPPVELPKPLPRRTPRKPPPPVSPPTYVPEPSLPSPAPLPEEPQAVAAAPAAATPAPSPAPPVAAAPAGPREVSALAYARKPQPEYPRLSRRQGEQGSVEIRVEVDEHGQPRKASVSRSSGYERLDQAALDAVRKAVFRPYVENGRPLPAVGRVMIEFRLEH